MKILSSVSISLGGELERSFMITHYSSEAMNKKVVGFEPAGEIFFLSRAG